MFYFLIIAVIIFAGGAAYALIRGLLAFAQMGEDISSDIGRNQSFQKQNGFMFARVKWQAMAIVAIVIIAGVAGADT